MRLAAVYIPENSLPHIFGEDHDGLTINLGGEYFYYFNETDKEIKIESKIKNELFIPNFYNQDISHISTIVGQNGVGKSTLLRALNHSIDPSSRKNIQIYEIKDEKNIEVFNDTLKRLTYSKDIKVNTIEKSLFEPLYYSPCLDYDLKSTFSPITLVNFFDVNLEDYFLDSVYRNVSLLNDKVVDEIKKIYEDFPDYNSVTIKAKKLKKSVIRAPYLESNFGTPHKGDALKNEIEGEISRLEHDENYGKKEYSKKDIIENYKHQVNFLKSESFSEQFNKIWEIDDYIYKDDSGYDYIHNSADLIKNTEINILSFLLLGAVFPQTGLGGGINFSEVSKTKNFKERLDFFLEMYLVNEEELLTDKIKKSVKIDVSNIEPIIDIIANYKFSKIRGVDLNQIKKRMISYLNSFSEINNFYNKLKQFSNDNKISFNKNELIFNIKNDNVKLLFDELIFSYKYVLKSFPKAPIDIILFDIIPDKKLSTGEKSLLDFYSSIFAYIDANKETPHQSREYYLMLLDEPDLGFHPLWKKKFINAISKTLPILFSKIKPHKYDGTGYIKGRENPIIQIIFTTHDPLTLSDLPNHSVIYLKKEGEYSKILKNDDPERPEKTFGANIHELLSDSFFMGNGLVGEFAKEKIEGIIEWLNVNDNNSIEEEKFTKDKYLLINLIDETILKVKLLEMYGEKMGISLKNKILEEQIKYLESLRDD